ncbi:alpha/beta hydrolase [Corynebacterium kroppenstedtii]|uniref:alpha/beta hydrolase n=1 Tax=Corynebacterium sp. PCR 32 TaxID=3351342 RepID=UPI0030970A64
MALTRAPQWNPHELDHIATTLSDLIPPMARSITTQPIHHTIIGGINGDAANAALKSINTHTHTVINQITQSTGLLRAHAAAVAGPLRLAHRLEEKIDDLEHRIETATNPLISAGLKILKVRCKCVLTAILTYIDVLDGVLAHLITTIWNSLNNQSHTYPLSDTEKAELTRDNSNPWHDGQSLHDTDHILRERLSTWISTAHNDEERKYLVGIEQTLKDNPDAHLIHLDHNGVAIALGDPTTAPAVATLIGGVGSSKPEHIGGHTEWANTIRQKSGNTTSVIAWSAYPAPPTLLDAPSTANATRGAHNLRSFQQSLRQRNPNAQLTVTGHSYGSVVVGHAAQPSETAPPLEADSVIILGSPGTGVNSAHELAPHARDGHAEIVVGRKDADPIMLAVGPRGGAHGTDPSYPHWDADAWITRDGLAPAPPCDQKIRDLGALLASRVSGNLLKNHDYKDYSDAIARVTTEGVTTTRTSAH